MATAYTDYLDWTTGATLYAKARPLNATWATGIVAYAETAATGEYYATLDASAKYAVFVNADGTPGNEASSDLKIGDVGLYEFGADTYDADNESLEAIRARGDAAWTSAASNPNLLLSTTIATLASQTSFTLTAGSTDDDAYNNAYAIVTDAVTANQTATAVIGDYIGSSKTITLKLDPAVFTMAAGDTISIIAGADVSAIADAVWDEATADHQISGSFGARNQDSVQYNTNPDANVILIRQGDSYDDTAQAVKAWTVAKDYTGWTGTLSIKHRTTEAELLTGTVTITVSSATLLEATLTTANTAFAMLTSNDEWGEHPYEVVMTSGSSERTAVCGVAILSKC